MPSMQMPINILKSDKAHKTAKISSGCIIGFDQLLPQLKIMSVGDKNSVKTLPYSDELFKTDKYAEMITDAFSKAPSQIEGFDSSAVIAVLPNSAFAVDIAKVPNLSRFKMNDALRVQNEEMYKNHKDLRIHNTQIATAKAYSTYASYIVRKEITDSVKDALARFKFTLKCVTFSANCEINSVLQFSPKAKQRVFMFADILENETRISFCCKGKTVGFSHLPFGYSILKDDEVADEQFLWNHDAAAIAVINAAELAKAKKSLTAAVSVEEPTPEQPSEETEEPAPYEMDHSDEDFGLDEEELVEQRLEEQRAMLATNKPKYKKFVRKVRKLPKFMQRPEPETPEQTVSENFRIILKWLLLNKRFIERSENYMPLDYIMINIPEKYRSLCDEVTQDPENKATVKVLDENGYNCDLDLIGAQFVHAFNQSGNF